MRQNFEWQVSNLELSKKLKTLGVKQESLFYYLDIGVEKEEYEIRMKKDIPAFENCPTSIFSAFTMAELGEMFLRGKYSLYKNGITWTLSIYINNEMENTGGPPYTIAQTANTEADVYAKILIYLIEKGLANENKE